MHASPVSRTGESASTVMLRSSYIICTRDRPDELIRCVRSIAAQEPSPDELIIVDASVPAIAAQNCEQVRVSLKDIAVRLLYCTSPRASLPFQRNLGVEYSAGDILFFVDDDVILLPDFHRTMLELWRANWHNGLGGIQGSAVNAKRPSFK